MISSSNASSLVYANALNSANALAAKSSERISTTLKINRASDDPAGLVKAMGFKTQVGSYTRVLDNLSNIAWFDLPLDYLDTWSAEIDKITASQIQQAFARNLQPERMVTVILGAKP